MKIVTLAALSLAAALAASPEYHVTGKIHIGGEGGWDYLAADGQGRRLYVSHGTHVTVVDLDSGRVAGDIPDTPGVHGIAVASKRNRGYISNGRSNNVTVFELSTLKTLGHIATGENPDAILYDPSSDRVMTFNGRSKDMTVIDPESQKVVATVPLKGRPEFAVSDGKGKVYANMEDTHELVVIDPRSSAVTKRYSLEGCEDPSGLAVDARHGRLFSVCSNKVMAVSDPAQGKVVATVPIGEGPDAAGFDPDRRLAFSSNGDGTLTVVRESGNKYEVVANVPTERGARTMALDPKTHKIYLPTAQFGPAPAPTTERPHPRPVPVPDTFTVLVVGE